MSGVLSREAELLLFCSRTSFSDHEAQRVHDLAAGALDWEKLLAAASVYGVLPLLAKNLRASDIPPGVLARLHQSARDNARHCAVRTAALLKLVAALEAEKIPAVPFKGPALSALLYGDPGLRQAGDLDLLVREADVRAAGAVVRTHGFLPEFELDPHREQLYLRYAAERTWRDPESMLEVELHWQVTSPHLGAVCDAGPFWHRLTTCRLENTTLRCLAPEDHLTALCMHGSKHGWWRLLWICDVAELLRAFPLLDGDAIWERAGEASPMVALGLTLACDLMHAKLFGAIPQPFQDRALRATVKVSARIGGLQGDPGAMAVNRMLLGLQNGLLAKSRALARLTLTPSAEDLTAIRLPRGMRWLYRPMRMMRLTGKFLRSAFS